MLSDIHPVALSSLQVTDALQLALPSGVETGAHDRVSAVYSSLPGTFQL